MSCRDICQDILSHECTVYGPPPQPASVGLILKHLSSRRAKKVVRMYLSKDSKSVYSSRA